MQIKELRENGSLRIATINNEKSLTQQQFKAECDVNNIMKKYEQTGEIHHLNRSKGVYQDLSQFTNYQEMLHKVMDAEQAFDALPAETRKRFNNNPQELIEFLGDNKNKEEAIKLGLVEQKQNEQIQTNEPQSTQPVPPTT